MNDLNPEAKTFDNFTFKDTFNSLKNHPVTGAVKTAAIAMTLSTVVILAAVGAATLYEADQELKNEESEDEGIIEYLDHGVEAHWKTTPNI